VAVDTGGSVSPDVGTWRNYCIEGQFRNSPLSAPHCLYLGSERYVTGFESLPSNWPTSDHLNEALSQISKEILTKKLGWKAYNMEYL
jgi:hypothetical protein